LREGNSNERFQLNDSPQQPSSYGLPELRPALRTITQNHQEGDAAANSKKAQYEQRIKQAEHRIAQLLITDEQHVKSLKDSLATVLSGVQAETQARELLEEKKTKEMKLAENNI